MLYFVHRHGTHKINHCAKQHPNEQFYVLQSKGKTHADFSVLVRLETFNFSSAFTWLHVQKVLCRHLFTYSISPSSFLVNSHVPRLGGLCWAQPERVHGDDFHTHAKVGSKPTRTHTPKF